MHAPDSCDTASSATQEQRLHERYRCEFRISLQILYPEETFTPVINVCKSYDISFSGMRVIIDDFSFAQYKKLLSSVRYARLSFMDDDSGKEIKLMGRIVWVDLHKQAESEKLEQCYLAVAFEERDRDNFAQFMQNYVRTQK